MAYCACIIFCLAECECYCLYTESRLSFGGTIALAVTLTFLLTLLTLVVGVLSILVANKCRRSENITMEIVTEIIPPPVIYDEIKPDPFTQGNSAYELVRPN